ncbi:MULTISPECIES: NUDIX hydrolase [Culturomica]|jgi:8-oxo-dGTP pyrophosphatase MutT (NUDIX family)|uniref:NUDIX hydrolase n=1 Tax=Culturomica TaxID=1926651 RepID=UPI00033A3CD3|nr:MULTISPECIES: CoA pyrophosphatase [Culturomica]CCZ06259.1 nUDIX hydrolase [Odoribacter sp. CAG:788]HBO27142.1 CoA pyrophosphatase [Culturomica sp.]
MSSRKIRTALYNVLPGEKAHCKMAPRPKYIAGIEGIHSTPPVNSAVLILIVPYENELAIPFIKRVNRGKYHGGQIAFPGGKMEKEDTNALQTALRECHEEIGVPEEKVSILGVLSDIYIPLSNFNITPIVGTTLKLPDFTLSRDEVECVLLVKLSDLFNDKNKTTHSFVRHDHEIIAPGYTIGENFIWGATAMIIAELEQLMKTNTFNHLGQL